jgi:hypothetical protein
MIFMVKLLMRIFQLLVFFDITCVKNFDLFFGIDLVFEQCFSENIRSNSSSDSSSIFFRALIIGKSTNDNKWRLWDIMFIKFVDLLSKYFFLRHKKVKLGIMLHSGYQVLDIFTNLGVYNN